MNKQKFVQVAKNYTSISAEDRSALHELVKSYPYSQIIHTLIAKANMDKGTDIAKQTLNYSAMYATDRSVLKEIIEETAVEEIPSSIPDETIEEVVTQGAPSVEESQNKVIEDVSSAEPATFSSEDTPSITTEQSLNTDIVHEKITISEEINDADQELLRDSILEGLDKLQENKATYLNQLSAAATTKAPAKKKVTSRSPKPKTTGKTASTTKSTSTTSTTKPAKATERKTSTAKKTTRTGSAKVSTAKKASTKTATIASSKKTTPTAKVVNSTKNTTTAAKTKASSKTSPTTKKSATKASTGKATKAGTTKATSKTSTKTKAVVAKKPSTTKATTTKTSTKKKVVKKIDKPSKVGFEEQREIIETFIEKEPTITSQKSTPTTAETEMKDLSAKSTAFDDNLISENLAQILVSQGKTSKAIDIYKKLIWKFPQKKSYFANQIEKLKK